MTFKVWPVGFFFKRGKLKCKRIQQAPGQLRLPLSLINNRMVAVPQAPGAFKAGSKMWDYFIGV